MSNDLKANIWEKEQYYETISSLEDFKHPGFERARALTKDCPKILDVGCGDGSKLSKLGGSKSSLFGTEISQKAVKEGKKKFPKIKFTVQKEDKLPFEDNYFDAVTSFFVLEHTSRTQDLINEMLRVTKSGGLLILLAPNFGSPNRASPNFEGSRQKKLLQGLIADFSSSNSLNWHKVTPIITDISEFKPDLDTTIEPYLGSLVRYLKKYGKIVEVNSFWNMEEGHPKLIQKIFRKLSQWNIYPFKYWGPHLFVVLKKE